MKAQVACPSCRQKLALSAAMLGQQVQCPACGTHFLTKVTKVNADTQVNAPPVPTPAPARSDPAGPARNSASVKNMGRSLDDAGAPLKLQGTGGKGKFKKDMTRVLMEEGKEVEKRQGGGEQGSTSWVVLLMLPLLVIGLLALYLCGVFDGPRGRSDRKQSVVPVAQVPPQAQGQNRPTPDPDFKPVLPPQPGNAGQKGPNPPDKDQLVQGLASPTRFPGLVGYWPMELQKDNPEMADESGRGHPIVLRQGSVLKVAGVRGGAVQLRDKTGLDYGAAEEFNFPTNGGFTLACWVKTTAVSGTVVSQRHSGDEGAAVNLTVEGGRAVATVRQTGERRNPAAVRSRVLVNDDQWHHCALVRRGNAIELYVDGTPMERAEQPGLNGPIVTDWRSVGTERRWASENKSDLHGVSTYYVGAVDEFCVYNRDLTAAEIRQLATR
jgi:hypothetical protein